MCWQQRLINILPKLPIIQRAQGYDIIDLLRLDIR